jgi:hypothetical protein
VQRCRHGLIVVHTAGCLGRLWLSNSTLVRSKSEIRCSFIGAPNDYTCGAGGGLSTDDQRLCAVETTKADLDESLISDPRRFAANFTGHRREKPTDKQIRLAANTPRRGNPGRKPS